MAEKDVQQTKLMGDFWRIYGRGPRYLAFQVLPSELRTPVPRRCNLHKAGLGETPLISQLLMLMIELLHDPVYSLLPELTGFCISVYIYIWSLKGVRDSYQAYDSKALPGATAVDLRPRVLVVYVVAVLISLSSIRTTLLLSNLCLVYKYKC